MDTTGVPVVVKYWDADSQPKVCKVFLEPGQSKKLSVAKVLEALRNDDAPTKDGTNPIWRVFYSGSDLKFSLISDLSNLPSEVRDGLEVGQESTGPVLNLRIERQYPDIRPSPCFITLRGSLSSRKNAARQRRKSVYLQPEAPPMSPCNGAGGGGSTDEDEEFGLELLLESLSGPDVSCIRYFDRTFSGYCLYRIGDKVPFSSTVMLMLEMRTAKSPSSPTSATTSSQMMYDGGGGGASESVDSQMDQLTAAINRSQQQQLQNRQRRSTSLSSAAPQPPPVMCPPPLMPPSGQTQQQVQQPTQSATTGSGSGSNLRWSSEDYEDVCYIDDAWYATQAPAFTPLVDMDKIGVLRTAEYTSTQGGKVSHWMRYPFLPLGPSAVRDEKAKELIRRGIPDQFRNRVWKYVTGGDRFLHDRPASYERALVGVFGDMVLLPHSPSMPQLATADTSSPSPSTSSEQHQQQVVSPPPSFSVQSPGGTLDQQQPSCSSPPKSDTAASFMADEESSTPPPSPPPPTATNGARSSWERDRDRELDRSCRSFDLPRHGGQQAKTQHRHQHHHHGITSSTSMTFTTRTNASSQTTKKAVSVQIPIRNKDTGEVIFVDEEEIAEMSRLLDVEQPMPAASRPSLQLPPPATAAHRGPPGRKQPQQHGVISSLWSRFGSREKKVTMGSPPVSPLPYDPTSPDDLQPPQLETHPNFPRPSSTPAFSTAVQGAGATTVAPSPPAPVAPPLSRRASFSASQAPHPPPPPTISPSPSLGALSSHLRESPVGAPPNLKVYNASPRFAPTFGGTLRFEQHCLNEWGTQAARRVLCVVAEQNPDVEYCPCLPDLVCSLLMYLCEEECYAAVTSMLERTRDTKWYFRTSKFQHALVLENFKDVARAHIDAKLFKHLERLGVDMGSVIRQWFDRLFYASLPLPVSLRVLDAYLSEGSKILYRVGIALLKALQTELLAAGTAERVMAVLYSGDAACASRSQQEEFFKAAFRVSLSRQEIAAMEFKNQGSLDAVTVVTAMPQAHVFARPKTQYRSQIVDDTQWELLWTWLPQRVTLRTATLAFATYAHGFSLNTLITRCQRDPPFMLLVCAVRRGGGSSGYEQSVFGAFVTDPLARTGGTYTGKGEAFLFRLSPDERVYRWTQCNSFFAMVNESGISIGAGGDGTGLRIDADLTTGSSAACETFGNDPLCATGEDFTVLKIEVVRFASAQQQSEQPSVKTENFVAPSVPSD